MIYRTILATITSTTQMGNNFSNKKVKVLRTIWLLVLWALKFKPREIQPMSAHPYHHHTPCVECVKKCRSFPTVITWLQQKVWGSPSAASLQMMSQEGKLGRNEQQTLELWASDDCMILWLMKTNIPVLNIRDVKTLVTMVTKYKQTNVIQIKWIDLYFFFYLVKFHLRKKMTGHNISRCSMKKEYPWQTSYVALE